MTLSFRPNGGTLRALLTIAAAFLIAWAASAQMRGTIDLAEVYSLSHVRGKLTVSQVYTQSEATATFPRAAQVCTARGYDLMQLSCFDAAWMDAVWQGQGGGQPVGGVLASQNHVIVPPGEYWQTVVAEFSGGHYQGAGTGYAGNGSVNTTLLLWHERWQGDPAERHCLQSGTWDASGIFSYVEGTIIEGFQLIGRSKEFSYLSFNSCGIRMWKPGETTVTRHVFARDFRTAGIQMHAPTPHTLEVVSVFDNVVAGLHCVGCWGGTIEASVSGDDNGRLILSVPYYHPDGRVTEAGGTWNVTLTKSETFVASGAGSDRVWRGQAIELHGQFAANFEVVSAASGNGYPDALFIVDPRLTNGTVQQSMVKAMVKGFGYQTLLHDLRGTRYGWHGDYRAVDFRWHADEGMDAFPAVSGVPGCTEPVAFEYTGFPANDPSVGNGCEAYRYIVDGLPNTSETVYLDELTGTQPPPPDPDPCTGWETGEWGECVNGQQTRSVTAIPAGCAGTPPGARPADTRSCTVTPPPSGDGPDVTVVVNSADPASASMAAAYCAAWNIPTSHIVTVNAGNGHDANASQAGAIRSAVEADGRQYTCLAMSRPSRVGAQSITSFVTFGPRSVSSLTASPLLDYTGTTPRTDRGVAPSWILLSEGYIRKDADGSRPGGGAYAVYANDQSGTPRGSARKGQAPSGVTVWDNTTGAVGRGVNPCNYLSNNCWISSRKPIDPVIAAYQSMYILGDDGGITWQPGFYGDHVTSFGGYLDGNDPNGVGQTPLTYYLDRGASFSVGSVSEPWQGGDGRLAVQFVNIAKFHPLFTSGLPVGVAAWASVQCPDRMLFAGDGLCAPFK